MSADKDATPRKSRAWISGGVTGGASAVVLFIVGAASTGCACEPETTILGTVGLEAGTITAGIGGLIGFAVAFAIAVMMARRALKRSA